MEDEILLQVRVARERLIAQHGSFKAYVKYLRALEQASIAKNKAKVIRPRKRKPATIYSLITAQQNGKFIASPRFRNRPDPIVDAVRRTRDNLYEQFGSFDALFDHFQEMDRQHRAREKAKAAKKRAQKPPKSRSRRSA